MSSKPTKSNDNTDQRGWRAPTRRSFVAMITAAAAAFVVKDNAPTVDLRKNTHGKTRWIGHV